MWTKRTWRPGWRGSWTPSRRASRGTGCASRTALAARRPVDALFYRASFLGCCDAGAHTVAWEFDGSRQALTVRATCPLEAGDELTFDAASKPWMGLGVDAGLAARCCNCGRCRQNAASPKATPKSDFVAAAPGDEDGSMVYYASGSTEDGGPVAEASPDSMEPDLSWESQQVEQDEASSGEDASDAGATEDAGDAGDTEDAGDADDTEDGSLDMQAWSTYVDVIPPADEPGHHEAPAEEERGVPPPRMPGARYVAGPGRAMRGDASERGGGASGGGAAAEMHGKVGATSEVGRLEPDGPEEQPAGPSRVEPDALAAGRAPAPATRPLEILRMMRPLRSSGSLSMASSMSGCHSFASVCVDVRLSRLLQRCTSEGLTVQREAAERALSEAGGQEGKAMIELRRSAAGASHW